MLTSLHRLIYSTQDRLCWCLFVLKLACNLCWNGRVECFSVEITVQSSRVGPTFRNAARFSLQPTFVTLNNYLSALFNTQGSKLVTMLNISLFTNMETRKLRFISTWMAAEEWSLSVSHLYYCSGGNNCYHMEPKDRKRMLVRQPESYGFPDL